MRARPYAIASGLLLGGLLYFLYAENNLVENNWWYGAGFLALTVFGLGWLFPRNWRAAASSTVVGALAGLLISQGALLGFVLFMGAADAGLQSALLALAEALGGFLLVLAGALLVAWIGSWISRRLSGLPALRLLGLVPVVAALGTVIAIAHIRQVQQADLKRRQQELTRDVIKKVPGLMQSVYQAEMAYSAGQPDKAFTCNGHQLSKIPGLEWTFNPYSYSYYQIEPYTIGLYCAEENRPHRFCLTAFPWDRTHPSPAFWMDEKGKLAEGDATRKSPETACSVP